MHRLHLISLAVVVHLLGCTCGFAAHIGAHTEDAATADSPNDAAGDVSAFCEASQDVRFVTREPTRDEAVRCSLDVDHPTLWYWTGGQCTSYSFSNCSRNLFCDGADCNSERAYSSFDACASAHRRCFQSCGDILSTTDYEACVVRCDGTMVAFPFRALAPPSACGPEGSSVLDPASRTQVCECSRCGAQDAREGDPSCSNPVPARFAWNGNDCTRICSCVGGDCDRSFDTRSACLSAYASCARGCSPMEVGEALSACGGPTRWYFNGSRCRAINECACIGFDCQRTYETEGACVAAFSACGTCNPYDAHDGPGDCDPASGGFSWNGESCVGFACSCVGAECTGSRSPYQQLETCVSAHSGCMATGCLAQDAFPRTAEVCPAVVDPPRYRWNGRQCEGHDYSCGCRGRDCSSLFATEAECIATYQDRCTVPACPSQEGEIHVSVVTLATPDRLSTQWYLTPGWRGSTAPPGYRFFVNDEELPGTSNAALPQTWYPAGQVSGPADNQLRLRAESPCGSWSSVIPLPVFNATFQAPIRIDWR